jgi:hypothetical protein
MRKPVAATLPPKMPAPLRVAVKTVASLMWISGCVWLVLHYFFAEQTEFGVGPNRWEATTIRVHGVVAILAVFLFGWIVSQHVVDAWRQPRNRVRGIVFAFIVTILVMSGYALYYVTNESGRAFFAITHEAIGVLAIVAALLHWKGVKR